MSEPGTVQHRRGGGLTDRLSHLPNFVKAPTRPVRRRFRYATRRRRLLPAFLIIGAQRAGTTTLYTYLRRHPDVTGPRYADASVYWSKELHFFDENYWRGVDWYRRFFPLEARQRAMRRLGRDLVPGEGTPYYMFHPAVPERAAETLPDVRLVALLRNPVERAYSHYQHMVKSGREKLSFEQAIEAEEQRLAGVEELLLQEQPVWGKQGHRKHQHHRHRAYVSRGLYADQLERWLAHFPREQLLVVRSEDFLAQPDEIYAEVFDFLGLRPWGVRDYEPRNVGAYAPIKPEVRAGLEQRFAEPNARLARLLGRDFGWDAAGSASTMTDRPQSEPQTESEGRKREALPGAHRAAPDH
jgi:Sulfotransferase domain